MNLSVNKLCDSGVKLLCEFLESPLCRMKALSLSWCNLTWNSCAYLASALKSSPFQMRRLDLSGNDVGDSGVELMCDLLESPHCRLEVLALSYCRLLEISCASLASALKSNPTRLRELHLDGNELQDSDLKLLRCLLESPCFRLDTLCVEFNVFVHSHVKADVKENLPEDHKKAPLLFLPELTVNNMEPSYRFMCPGPGVFHCALTGLVFGMAQEAELLYKTVQWDERVLQSAGRGAAGPLFEIKCSVDAAVCQLHLPHCETKDVLLVDGLLKVAHIADDGMTIMKPLEITDTHVVVDVPHLSAFGLVWDVIQRFLNMAVPVNGQVLLFLRPPYSTLQVLDVFVLQDNIPASEVAAQQEDAKYIRVSSDCLLNFGQSYCVTCEPEVWNIQPEDVSFRSKYGPNFHPTFEVFLETIPKKMTLIVQDKEKKEVWKRNVCLSGLGDEAPQMDVPAVDRLLSVRREFVKRVSETVLDQLLDRLLERQVLNDEEMQTAKVKEKAEKARYVIDAARNKGSKASAILISAFCEVEPSLSKELKFK